MGRLPLLSLWDVARLWVDYNRNMDKHNICG